MNTFEVATPTLNLPFDAHPQVDAFVKNAGLGFAIPYLHNGQSHDYLSDFIIRWNDGARHLIRETRRYDELAEVKAAAADRWVAAVNADGGFGGWSYVFTGKVADIGALIVGAATPAD